MKNIILLCAFALLNFSTHAQPGIGCLRTNDGLLYSQKNIFGYYELLGNKYPTSAPTCPRVQLGTKTGVKCQFIVGGIQFDEYNYVLYTANGPVQCNIDHYVYLIITACGILGYIKVKGFERVNISE